MTEADQKTAAPADPKALLKDLHARIDAFRNHAPLAIGIDKQLLAQQPELDRKTLRTALRSHTMSTRYLKEMQTACVRLNLDGSEAGEVTEEARTHAGELLRERFKKQAEQRRAQETAAKAAAAAARAEEMRQAKLSQLAEKFGRKQT